MRPFEPLWLVLVKRTVVIVTVVLCYAWVMESDYVSIEQFEVIEPIEQSIRMIQGSSQGTSTVETGEGKH